MSTIRSNRAIVVIPALDPPLEPFLALLYGLVAHGFRVVVVDDGSKELEAQEAFNQAKSIQNVAVIHSEQNLGKGSALKRGFNSIISQDSETLSNLDLRTHPPQIIVTADADGQHLVDDIVSIYRRAASALEEADKFFVYGERNFSSDPKQPFRSRFGNFISATLVAAQTGTWIPDTQSGLRAFPAAALEFVSNIPGKRYDYESRTLLKIMNEPKIQFIPHQVSSVYLDKTNSVSKFRPIRDGVQVFRQLSKFAAISALSALVDITLFALFYEILGHVAGIGLATEISAANLLARTLSLLFNFSLNKWWVFRSSNSTAKAFPKYLALAGLIFLLSTLGTFLVSLNGGINPLFAKATVDVLLFFISWLVQRKKIFKGVN